MASVSYHDVARVPISNAQHVGGNTIPCARPQEVIGRSLKELRLRVLLLQVIPNSLLNERTHHTEILVDLLDCQRISNHLNHPHVILSGYGLVGFHPKIKPSIQPNLIHDLYQL